MCAHHAKFFARTVLVKGGDVDGAYRSLDRIMRNEKITERARRFMYYEKPWQYRQRVSFEKCKRIYNAEMSRKISFIMRANRQTPWPN